MTTEGRYTVANLGNLILDAADNSWGFEANKNIADEQNNPSFIFTVIVEDGDGDKSELIHTVTITNNQSPTGESFSIPDIDDGTTPIQFVGLDEKYDIDGNSTGSDGDYISDAETPTEDLSIKVESLPEHGRLFSIDSNGKPTLITEDMLGQSFDQDSLVYEADASVPRGYIIGDTRTDNETSLSNWGVEPLNSLDPTVGEGTGSIPLQLEDGKTASIDLRAVTVDDKGNETPAYFAIPENGDDKGGGLGIVSSDPGKKDIDNPSEKIVATFNNIAVFSITLTLDGLGKYYIWDKGFDPDNGGHPNHQKERVEISVKGADGNIIPKSSLDCMGR